MAGHLNGCWPDLVTTAALLPDDPRRPARSDQPHLFLFDEPSTPFDPAQTFPLFTVAPSNRLAYSISSTCAQSDPPFDLVFLHGAPGSGKTHLLHAIGLQARGAHPGHQIHLLCASDPAADWQQLSRLQPVDLLLVDDVQFLPSWADELLCAAVDRRPLTVVVTADRPPEDLTASSRLRSRLAGGLVAEVGFPGSAGREEILRNWARRLNTDADDELLTKLAAKFPGDTRALIGTFRRLAAESAVDNQPLTVAFAESHLPALNAPGAALTPTAILAAAAKALDFAPHDLSGPRRQRGVVAARQIAMFLARQLTDASYPTIAAAFGRDHTTVIHAVEKIGAELLQDPTKARLSKVISQLDVDSTEVWAELQRRFPRQRPSTRTGSPSSKTKASPSTTARRPETPPPSPAAGTTALNDVTAIAAAADAVIAQVAVRHTGGAKTIEELAQTSGLPAQTLIDAWQRRARPPASGTAAQRSQSQCA